MADIATHQAFCRSTSQPQVVGLLLDAAGCSVPTSGRALARENRLG